MLLTCFDKHKTVSVLHEVSSGVQQPTCLPFPTLTHEIGWQRYQTYWQRELKLCMFVGIFKRLICWVNYSVISSKKALSWNSSISSWICSDLFIQFLIAAQNQDEILPSLIWLGLICSRKTYRGLLKLRSMRTVQDFVFLSFTFPPPLCWLPLHSPSRRCAEEKIKTKILLSDAKQSGR